MVARILVASALFFLLYSGADAEPDGVFTLGIGSALSCAAWLSTPARDNEATVWIWGFWSGLNARSADIGRNAQLGSHADAFDIIADVRSECSREPRQLLYYATVKAYATFERREVRN